MNSLQLVQIFGIFALFIKWANADCTSCPSITVVCNDNAGLLGLTDGILTQTFGSDGSGCKTVKLACNNDMNSATTTLIYDQENDLIFEQGQSLTCSESGLWLPIGNNPVIYCNVDMDPPVTTPTCAMTETSPSTSPSPTTMTASTSTDSSTVSQSTSSGSCCHEWSSWTSTTPCSDSCGGCDIVTFTRTCLTNSTCPCPGAYTKTEPCNLQPCAYPRKSCCENFRARAVDKQILCMPLNQTSIPPPPQTCNCCPEQGIWGAWMDVNCTDTCGGYGTGLRRRICLSEDIGCPCTGESTKTDVCKLQPCSYPKRSCQSPMTLRVVDSKFQCVSNSSETIIQTTCCPSEGIWEPWSAWSDCPTACGACSNATRRRTCASAKYGCPCNSAETFQTLPCNRKACLTDPPCCSGSPTVLSNGDSICGVVASTSGEWGPWTDSGCSVTCGLCGTIQQNRTCLSGSCTGPSTQSTTTPCGDGLCSVSTGNPSCCSPSRMVISEGRFICQ